MDVDKEEVEGILNSELLSSYFFSNLSLPKLRKKRSKKALAINCQLDAKRLPMNRISYSL